MKTIIYTLIYLLLTLLFVTPLSDDYIVVTEIAVEQAAIKTHHSELLKQQDYVGLGEFTKAQSSAPLSVINSPKFDKSAFISMSLQLTRVETCKYKNYLYYFFDQSYIKDVIFPFHSFW